MSFAFGSQFRKNLVKRELSTNDEVLKAFQLSYIEIEKRLETVFRVIQSAKDSGQAISPNLLFERVRLESLLGELGFEIDKLSLELGRITSKAQRDSITAAIAETNTVFQAGNVIDKGVNSIDADSMRELVGLGGNGDPISKLFNSIKEPFAQSVKTSLINGIALGSSPEEIAREIKTALGTSTAHALTISRTETNRVYRETTRAIYHENRKLMLGYTWVSARDLRTCPICWAMHGEIFPTSEKFATHPNCRCTLVAVLTAKDKIERGSESFARLTPAQQKAILGSKRFDLYSQNTRELADFVGEKNTDFGKARYIRPLSELNVKAEKKQKPEPQKKTATAKPKVAPGRPKTAKNATERMRAVAARIDERLAEIRTIKKSTKLPLKDENATKKYISLLSEEATLMSTRQKQILDVLRVEKPTNVRLNFTSKFKKINKDRINAAIDDFNSLVDEKFLKDSVFGMKKARSARAYFDGNNIAGYEHIGAATIVHEASHGLEQKGAGILDQALKFYEYRTENDKIVSLKIFNRAYASSEKTKVDKFFSPYVGKLPYMFRGKPFATEIMSMGVQKYYENPLEFANDDPEYFGFIFKVLRGEKWSKP